MLEDTSIIIEDRKALQSKLLSEKKRVLFVTDFSPNENGYAGPQTAYNFIKLFSDQQYLIFINAAHYKEIKPNKEWTINKDFFLFNYAFNISVKNRLNRICDKIKETVNPRYFHLSNRLKNTLDSFHPQTIICIPNDAYNYKAGLEIKKKYPAADLFFYIMDDYKHYEKPYLQKSFNDIFSKAKGWISISDAMATLFKTKFSSLSNKPYLVVQNPVNIAGMRHKQQKKSKSKIKIVYAGSVYPNHRDALLKVIEAINESKLAIELAIFTKDEFREVFREMESEKVIYKGSLNYKELLKTLPEFDYGLITETFLPEFANFAKSSIQTKVNDYILSGCLPLVVGPTYGACVHYIGTNRVGYTLTNNDTGVILNFLEGLMNDTNYSTTIHSAQNFLTDKIKETRDTVAGFVS